MKIVEKTVPNNWQDEARRISRNTGSVDYFRSLEALGFLSDKTRLLPRKRPKAIPFREQIFAYVQATIGTPEILEIYRELRIQFEGDPEGEPDPKLGMERLLFEDWWIAKYTEYHYYDLQKITSIIGLVTAQAISDYTRHMDVKILEKAVQAQVKHYVLPSSK